MNKAQKKALNEVKESLDSYYKILIEKQNILSSISDKEDEKLNNIPESLVGSEMYDKIESNKSYIDETIDSLGCAIEYIGDTIYSLDMIE